MATPRYLNTVPVDPNGAVPESNLPGPLPYELTTRAFVRTVEDVHDLLRDLNGLLFSKSYRRAETLLDPAGFSGLLSRTVLDRLAAASRTLVVNRFHNGYPDLLERGRYADDKAQHGEGGVEVKASRYDARWQTHGPRAGWFVVVQFGLDDRDTVAEVDLEPTRVVAVLVAPLELADWSWQPAGAGRIRSGTASVKASGSVKLRRGAVWVDPSYRASHDVLLDQARIATFRDNSDDLVVAEFRRLGSAASARDVASVLATEQGLDEAAAMSRVQSAFRRLRDQGRLVSVARGIYTLLDEVEPTTEP